MITHDVNSELKGIPQFEEPEGTLPQSTKTSPNPPPVPPTIKTTRGAPMTGLNKWIIEQYESGKSVEDAIKAFDKLTAKERKEIRGTNDDTQINFSGDTDEDRKKKRDAVYQAVRRHKKQEKND